MELTETAAFFQARRSGFCLWGIFQLIQMISLGLHHLPPLRQMPGEIVGRLDLIAFSMGQPRSITADGQPSLCRVVLAVLRDSCPVISLFP